MVIVSTQEERLDDTFDISSIREVEALNRHIETLQGILPLIFSFISHDKYIFLLDQLLTRNTQLLELYREWPHRRISELQQMLDAR